MTAPKTIAYLPNTLTPARVLTLALKAEFFDAIKAGAKTEEYRLRTPYWHTRIADRAYDALVLMRGYPRSEDDQKRIVLPWRGYRLRTIRHKHFGPDPVRVFAIRLTDDR